MANFSDSEGEIFEVDRILAHRGRGKSIEYLVRWRGFGEEEDSWEPANGLAAATDAVELYRENTDSLKTPRRQSRSRDGSGDAVTKTEKSTTKTKSGVITKTVTVTETTKQEGNWKLSENAKGHMSESSSPEASPTVTRRSLRSQKMVVTTTSGKNSTKQSESAAPSRLMSMLSAPCRMCASFKPTAKDIPIMILVTCLLVIAASFYVVSN